MQTGAQQFFRERYQNRYYFLSPSSEVSPTKGLGLFWVEYHEDKGSFGLLRYAACLPISRTTLKCAAGYELKKKVIMKTLPA